jgi:diguanylate cyclase (GGDEF)-like protein
MSDPLRDLIVLSLFLHSAGTIEEMMSILAERAPRVAGASVVLPLLVDRPREVLHSRALEGCDDPGLTRLWGALETDLTQVELPLSPPSTRGAVLDGGEVMLFDGLNELAEDVLGREACDIAKERLGLKKVALVPMVMEGEPLGLLVFVFDHADPDLEVLELLAGHCAVGLKTLTALDEAARFGEIDQVTWVYDRRYLVRALEDELKRSERYERSLSLVLLDIDGFSRFNRDYGSTLGDRLLRSVAMLLAESVSAPELVARAGADEFAVLLPETDRARAVTVVSRMLDRVSQVNVFGGSGVPDPVSVSVAIACYPEDGASSEELLEAAAAGLEEAKRDKVPGGRNAVKGKGESSSPRGDVLGEGRAVA